MTEWNSNIITDIIHGNDTEKIKIEQEIQEQEQQEEATESSEEQTLLDELIQIAKSHQN